MGTKTISIMKDVYDDLVRMKNREESFSDELRRLLSRRGKISECAGLWKRRDGRMAEDILSSIRWRRKAARELKMKRLGMRA